MLSVFPTMWLSLLAHALLRVFVGSILVYLGYKHAKKERVGLQVALSEHWPNVAQPLVWMLALTELVTGVMFFVGAFTQIAALAGMALSFLIIVFRRHFAHPSIPSPIFWVALFAASLSLLITGAGALAVDLPL